MYIISNKRIKIHNLHNMLYFFKRFYSKYLYHKNYMINRFNLIECNSMAFKYLNLQENKV